MKSHNDYPVVHFKADQVDGTRLIVPFYAFIWFEDWRHDLWAKRFIRDNLRCVTSVLYCVQPCNIALIISSYSILQVQNWNHVSFSSNHKCHSRPGKENFTGKYGWVVRCRPHSKYVKYSLFAHSCKRSVCLIFSLHSSIIVQEVIFSNSSLQQQWMRVMFWLGWKNTLHPEVQFLSRPMKEIIHFSHTSVKFMT